MSNVFQRAAASVMPIIGMLLFVAVFIVALVFFSYLFIAVAIVGFVLFCIAYVRTKIMGRKLGANQPTDQQQKGRTIDHDDTQ